MKKTVFIQNQPHYPTVWGDCVQTINLTAMRRGLGPWIGKDFHQRLSLWSKQNFNLSIDYDRQDPTRLYLDHFYAQNTGSRRKNTCVIDLKIAFDYLDADPKHRWCLYGLLFNPGEMTLGPEFIAENSFWIARKTRKGFNITEEEEPDVINSKLFFLENGNEVDENSPVIHNITWFFLYRAAELPIYFLIPNPDMIGVTPYIDDVDTEQLRFHVINPHFGPIGDTIFRPTFSANVKVLDAQKIVTGEKFHVIPFDHGVFRWRFKEEFPKVNLKVISNLIFKKDEETNKIYFEFNSNQETGFFQIIWGNYTWADLLNSSRSLDFIENKCKITIEVYKDKKYKYDGTNLSVVRSE